MDSTDWCLITDPTFEHLIFLFQCLTSSLNLGYSQLQMNFSSFAPRSFYFYAKLWFLSLVALLAHFLPLFSYECSLPQIDFWTAFATFLCLTESLMASIASRHWETCFSMMLGLVILKSFLTKLNEKLECLYFLFWSIFWALWCYLWAP